VTTVELGSGTARLLLRPNVDLGSAVPHSLTAELRVDSLVATRTVEHHYASGFADLAVFVESLTDDWRGWTGSRRWESLEGELELIATHDGHVRLAVTLRAANPSEWSATGTITIDPGEPLSAAARDVRALAAGFASS